MGDFVVSESVTTGGRPFHGYPAHAADM